MRVSLPSLFVSGLALSSLARETAARPSVYKAPADHFQLAPRQEATSPFLSETLLNCTGEAQIIPAANPAGNFTVEAYNRGKNTQTGAEATKGFDFRDPQTSTLTSWGCDDLDLFARKVNGQSINKQNLGDPRHQVFSLDANGNVHSILKVLQHNEVVPGRPETAAAESSPIALSCTNQAEVKLFPGNSTTTVSAYNTQANSATGQTAEKGFTIFDNANAGSQFKYPCNVLDKLTREKSGASVSLQSMGNPINTEFVIDPFNKTDGLHAKTKVLDPKQVVQNSGHSLKADPRFIAGGVVTVLAASLLF